MPFRFHGSLSIINCCQCFPCSTLSANQIMPLENEMKTPKSFVGFTGILNMSFVVIVALYVGMGLFGYLRYGDRVADSITLSLPEDEM